jgi:putative SOS response-associated peptidase YedK
MCGRFTLRTPPNRLVEEFLLAAPPPELFPRFNIAPTQDVLTIRNVEGQRLPAMLRWGLVPSWSKDAKGAAKLTNARSESVAEKPSFRTAFKRRRCLIPVDGYYEWKTVGKAKLPHLYEMQDERPFCFAGLWERWQDLETCTIITTSANHLAAAVHDRMPVILAPRDREIWLDPAAEANDLLKLLDPYPAGDMKEREVGQAVNNARNVLERIPEPEKDLFG